MWLVESKPIRSNVAMLTMSFSQVLCHRKFVTIWVNDYFLHKWCHVPCIMTSSIIPFPSILNFWRCATIPSALPLDLCSNCYPSNMQCMLNKDLPWFLLEYTKFEQAKGRLQGEHVTETYKTYSNTPFQSHHKMYHSCHKFVFMLIAPQQLVFKLKFLRIMQM